MEAVLNGPHGSTQLGANVTALGRTQDNQVVVNDTKASSHHAEIRSMGQEYTITDLGSTNGTFVNGQQLTSNMPRTLQSGDTVRIGDSTYTFEARNPQQSGYGIYGTQVSGSNPNLAPTQMAQPQYPGTAYGGAPSAQNFPPTQAATEYQQGGFQPYPGQQGSFPPPPPGGSSPNQYNQPTQAASYMSQPPPPQYNAVPLYNPNPAPLPGIYPAQGGGIPPYASPTTPPKRPGGLRTILLAVLALVVIIGAIATAFAFYNNKIAADNMQKTVTAQTATAVVNATATANAAGGDGPYATGTVALNDPLKDNSLGNKWDENANCSFTQGVYEVKEAKQDTFRTCFAQGTNYTNFSYRVVTTIISGDCTGLGFRVDTNTYKGYYYEVCQTGSYDLVVYDGSSAKYLISPTNSSRIKSGKGAINTLAITANNTTINLYANAIMLQSIQDSTIASGGIGVVALNQKSSTTNCGFAGAEVWTI